MIADDAEGVIRIGRWSGRVGLTNAQWPVSRAEFLSAARLEAEVLRELDARLPRRRFLELCTVALELTADPAFGLHSIERLTSDALNPLAALVAHAATLRDALSSIDEFRRMLGDDASFRCYEDGDRVVVRCTGFEEEPLRIRRFLTEVALGGLYLALRRFRAAPSIPQVHFAYAAPPYEHEYARVFEGRAAFDQEFSGICFDRESLQASAPHPDAELHHALRLVARRRLVHCKDQLPFAARVHQVLVAQPAPRTLEMRDVARVLGVSVRTLRRRLRDERKTYAGLVREAMASIAKTCLLDERRTIRETAFELGFADDTGFHRAFKRWTGLTPSEYRRRQAP